MKKKQNNKEEEKFNSFIEIKEKFFPKPTKKYKKTEEQTEMVGVHLANEFLESFKRRLSELNV